MFISDGDVGPAKEKTTMASSTAGGDGVEPGPSAEEISPATCHGHSCSKRTIRPLNRYGD